MAVTVVGCAVAALLITPAEAQVEPTDPTKLEALSRPGPEDEGAAPQAKSGPQDDRLREELAGPSAESATTSVEVLHHTSDAEVAATVEGAGGHVTGTVPGVLVEATVPVSSVTQLEALAGVDHVRSTVDITPEDPSASGAKPSSAESGGRGVAAVTGEEVAKTNVDDWQAVGHVGSGVKVGIIDGFDSTVWNSAQAAGEVAVPSGTFCRSNGSSCNIWTSGGSHGTGVAEIIHEQAPSAQLYLASVTSTSDLQAAFDYFVANGVKVVSRSESVVYDGPGNGTGPIATVVNNGVAAGLTIVKSAGNTAGNASRPGSYYRGTFSNNGSGYHDFNTTATVDTYLGFICGFFHGVRWSDWGEANPTDFDVEIYNSSFTLVNSYTATQNDASDPMLERPGCGVAGDVYFLRIKLFNAGTSAADTLEVSANASQLEFYQSPFSASLGMTDSSNPGLIAVGAIDPPNGTTIASYSSQGPTNDNRIKPDLSAASCVLSYTYSPNCFNGTSAAAPAVSGALAVVLGSGVVASPTPANLAAYMKNATVDRGAAGTDNVYGRGELRLPAPPAIDPNGRYVPLNSSRILDSRFGTGGYSTPWGAATTRNLTVTGVGGVPTSATAVVINVTVTGPTAGSHLTLYPNGEAEPTASNLNFVAGQTVPNLAIVKVGTLDQIRIRNNSGNVHVIVDVVGYFGPTGDRYNSLNSSRILDSRFGTGGFSTPWGAATTRNLAVTGVGGVPTSATAVVINVTITNATAGSHLTLYPNGEAEPTASNLNFVAGQTVPNLAIVKVGTLDQIRIRNNSGNVDVIVDVVGYFGPTGAEYAPLNPSRILDSRFGTGGFSTPWGAATTRNLTVTGVGGVPTSATAVVINVTVTGPTAGSHLTLYPNGEAEPTASNLNFVAGQTVPNLAIVKVGTLDQIRIRNNSGNVHVIVDVVGFFA